MCYNGGMTFTGALPLQQLPQAVPCTRFTAEGAPCLARTRRPDGWCGRCAGHRVPPVPGIRTPQAMLQALTARMKVDTAVNQVWDLQRRQLYFAFGRLLDRLFLAQPNSWVVKGGFALLVRLPAAARPSKDLDLVYLDGPASLGLQALREAAELDLGDHVQLRVGDPQGLVEGNTRGLRLLVECFIGPKLWVRFPLDLVESTRVGLQPDWLPPLQPIPIALQYAPAWAVWPLAQHAADKVCACLERHGGRPSSRYRDLPDLWLLATQLRPEPQRLREALVAEARRRGLHLPQRFVVPNLPAWRAGWAQLARTCPQLRGQSFDGALQQVREWLVPALQHQGPV